MGMHFSPDPFHWRRTAEGSRRSARRSKGDLAYRMAGLGILAGSFGSTWLHRTLSSPTHAHPNAVIEGGLVLTTMALAAVGLLLIIHGAQLFKEEARRASPSARRRRRARSIERRTEEDFDPALFADGRIALASYLAFRTRTAADIDSRNRPRA